MKKPITVDGGKLIVGAPLEFCITLYAALLQRFPDHSAIDHFRWNVGDDADGRLTEVRKVMASDEFKEKGATCVFGPEARDLYDLEQRIDNFLTYCLPILPAIFRKNEDLLGLKSREITDLLEAIVNENARTGDAAPGAARRGATRPGFFLTSYLMGHLDQGQPGTREIARDRLKTDLSGLRGADLVDRLADILARQSQQIERLAATVRLLDVFEEHRDVLLKAEEPVFAEDIDLASSFELLASEYLPPTSGFHALEFTTDGTPFRWAGPDGTLTFAGYVDRRNGAEVRLELLYAANPENFERVKLLDGARPVPVEIGTSAGAGCVITATLPPRTEGGDTATRLTFRFPHTRKLSDDDDRIAAVAFNRLALTAVAGGAGDGGAAGDAGEASDAGEAATKPAKPARARGKGARVK